MGFIKLFENFRKHKIYSKARQLAELSLPEFKGDQVQMIPFQIDNPKLPENLKRWEPLVKECLKFSTVQSGTAFLTIDEKVLEPGQSHRRGGAHIDGNYYITEEWDTGPSPSWNASPAPSWNTQYRYSGQWHTNPWLNDLPQEVLSAVTKYKDIIDDDECELLFKEDRICIRTKKSKRHLRGGAFQEFKNRLKDDIPNFKLKVTDDYSPDEEDMTGWNDDFSYNWITIYFRPIDTKRIVEEWKTSNAGSWKTKSEMDDEEWFEDLPDEVIDVINNYKYILDDDECEVIIDANSIDIKTKKDESFFDNGQSYLEFRDRV